MICPGCRAQVPDIPGNPHKYIGSCAGCWQVYGEILARQYSEFKYPQPTHRLTVDTYAVQHPGVPGRQSAQSVNVHLIGLYLVIENKLQGLTATKALSRMIEDAAGFEWLEPPRQNGTITVLDVVKAQSLPDHTVMVDRWARDVWASWAAHHAHVARQVGRFLQ